MKHLEPFVSRQILQLPVANAMDWKLKRYAVIAEGRKFDPAIATSALDSAIERLPVAGRLDNPKGNHGVGFQIVHFAEVAIVSPVFYWIWGSVLANSNQMRAQWDKTHTFETGVVEVVGCVWEMEIVCYETKFWKDTMLTGGDAADNLARYLEGGLNPQAATR